MLCVRTRRSVGVEGTEMSEVLEHILPLYPSVELRRRVIPVLPALHRFVCGEVEVCLISSSLARFCSDQICIFTIPFSPFFHSL